MKAHKSTYILILLLAFYLVLHFAQAHGSGPEILRYYAKDLILIPILLLGINEIAPLINRVIHIGIKEIVLAVAYASIVFEGIMPILKPQVKTDWVDIVLYSAGGLVYYLISKPQTQQSALEK